MTPAESPQAQSAVEPHPVSEQHQSCHQSTISTLVTSNHDDTNTVTTPAAGHSSGSGETRTEELHHRQALPSRTGQGGGKNGNGMSQNIKS